LCSAGESSMLADYIAYGVVFAMLAAAILMARSMRG
jgi:hypothetical protein